MTGVVSCPQCIDAGTTAQYPADDVETQVRTVEAESLASFVDGHGEFEELQEITGWRLLPCGHEYSVGDWILIIDEVGVRLHQRARVMLIADDGEVLPA
jgi:hypothetical protein